MNILDAVIYHGHYHIESKAQFLDSIAIIVVVFTFLISFSYIIGTRSYYYNVTFWKQLKERDYLLSFLLLILSAGFLLFRVFTFYQNLPD